MKYNGGTYYLVGYKKRLYVACFHDTCLFLLNMDFTISKVLILGNLRKIGLRKKGDIALIFDDKKQNKLISLLSNFNRQIFCQELKNVVSNLIIDNVDQDKADSIFPVSGKAERIFFIRLLLQIMEEANKEYRIIQLINYFNRVIFEQTPKSIYTYEGYRKSINTENGKLYRKNLLLYLLNSEVVNRAMSTIYFSLRHLSFDKKKFGGYGSFLKKMLKNIKREKHLELNKKASKRKNSETSANSKLLKSRIRHNIVEGKKRSKKIENKCEYKNIQFTYYSNANHNKKNPKIVTLSTGCITIVNHHVRRLLSHHFRTTLCHIGSEILKSF